MPMTIRDHQCSGALSAANVRDPEWWSAWSMTSWCMVKPRRNMTNALTTFSTGSKMQVWHWTSRNVSSHRRSSRFWNKSLTVRESDLNQTRSWAYRGYQLQQMLVMYAAFWAWQTSWVIFPQPCRPDSAPPETVDQGKCMGVGRTNKTSIPLPGYFCWCDQPGHVCNRLELSRELSLQVDCP